jgi:hypothetical protein
MCRDFTDIRYNTESGLMCGEFLYVSFIFRYCICVGIMEIYRDFTDIRYKREDGLMCVASSAFLVPQNYADLDLELGDAELSVLCSVSGRIPLRILHCACSRKYF